MRPVQRGAAPASPFTDYDQALAPLRERLGAYCCYCERSIPTNLAVEHVQSRSKHPNLALAWDNFLLACVNCNSSKNNDNDTRAGYLWPDENNTLLAFSYVDGIVRNALKPEHPAHALAHALIKLTGLDKDPEPANRQPSKRDFRWMFRHETWNMAQRSKKRLAESDSTNMREIIIQLAQSSGGFSIWFEVFQNDADMRQRLLAAFPGCAEDCFDSAARPIPKPGGVI